MKNFWAGTNGLWEESLRKSTFSLMTTKDNSKYKK